MQRRCGTTFWAIAWIGVVAGGLCPGCGRDVRLSGRNVRTVVVKPVSLFGQTLDQAATPEQVVFAALQAIREDFRATTPTERDAALVKQFDLCAANILKAKNKSSLSGDEFVFNVVYRWTPTVAHYIGSFPTDWETARARLVKRDVRTAEKPKVLGTLPEPEEVEVAFEARPRRGELTVRALVSTVDKTGVEMEALTAASVAALTVYDMVKALEKGVTITNVQLLEKLGGKSGVWRRA